VAARSAKRMFFKTFSLHSSNSKAAHRGLLLLEQKYFDAGWSSPVARQAHNLKAAGSNPAPATKSKRRGISPALFLFSDISKARHEPSCSVSRPARVFFWLRT